MQNSTSALKPSLLKYWRCFWTYYFMYESTIVDPIKNVDIATWKIVLIYINICSYGLQQIFGNYPVVFGWIPNIIEVFDQKTE